MAINWYAIMVTCGTEARAIDALNQYRDDLGMARNTVNLTAWTPMRTLKPRRRALSKKSEFRQVALFPGYIFAQCDLDQSKTAAPIITSKTGARFVRDGVGLPAKIPDAALRAFMRLEAMGRYDEIRDMSERFAALIGNSLIMPDGPLAGWAVTVERAIDDETVEVCGETALGKFRAPLTVTPQMLGVG